MYRASEWRQIRRTHSDPAWKSTATHLRLNSARTLHGESARTTIACVAIAAHDAIIQESAA
jgi:hypothetical protein